MNKDNNSYSSHTHNFLCVFFIILCIPTFCQGQILDFVQFKDDEDHHTDIETIELTGKYDDYRVNVIFHDMEGFVWFGCDKGILRYDGARFKDFTDGFVNATKPPFSEIKCIRQQASGIIWFGSQQGLVKYDPSTSKFRWIQDNSGPDGGWAWNQIMYMILRDDYIWLATNHGISRINRITEQFDHHYDLSNEKDNSTVVNDLYLEDEKTLFFSTNLHHYKYDIATGTVIEMENAPKSWCSFYRDDFNNVWLSAYTGLFLYDSETDNYTRMLSDPGSENYIGQGMCVFLKHHEKSGYWIGMYNGCYKYSNDFEKEFFVQYSDGDVTGFQFDDDGNAWLATSEGIHVIRQRLRNFELLPSDHVGHLSISGIVETRNMYWLALKRKSDIYVYTHDFRPVKLLKIRPGNFNWQTDPNLHALLFDHEDRLWIASNGNGLYRCDDIFTKMRVTDTISGADLQLYYPEKKVTSLFEDTVGRIWMNMDGYLASYYDPDQKEFFNLKLRHSSEHPESIIKQMNVIIELDNGIFVSGTNQGLIAFRAPFRKVSEDTVEVTDYVNYLLPLKDNRDYHHINYLYRSPESNLLWVSTASSGFLCFKINGDQCSENLLEKQYEITIDKGLNTNEIRSIAGDRSGKLWFGTKEGLVRFDPEQSIFSFFGTEDGLALESFNEAAVHQDSGGRIFFGSGKGIVSLYPDKIEYDTMIPPVFITDIYINDNSIYKDSLLASLFFERQKPIRLKYAQRNLNIEFACLNYLHPEKNQFRYKLSGFNDNWVMNGNNASVLFSDLKAGKYEFFVEAGTGYGVWNHEGDSVSFIIRKPPWLTVPAFLLYLAIAASLIYLINLYIQSKARFLAAIQMEKKEKDQARELDEMKSRFFANISHEFRTPLTLIMGHVRDLEKQKGSERSIKKSSIEVLGRNARRLLLLINQLLDIAKLEKNALELELKKGDLSEWIRVLVSSFQSLADSQEIQFIAEIDDPEKEVCFDPDKTEKIVTNLLSNAFKFTEKGGKVAFRLQYFNGQDNEKEYVEIVVKDSGKGMDEEELSRIFDRFYQSSSNDTRSAEGSGIGLSLTKELVELLQGTITVESAPGKGTTFRAMLPVSEECFPGEDIQESDSSETIQTNIVVEDDAMDLPSEEGELPDQKPVILLVEDNPDLRKYLLDQMKISYRVLEAEDGRKGLEQAKQHLPDLVITDLMMPVMSGLEMMEALKQDPATNHIPVIMLTAKADMQSKLEGLETGADDYIIKPFNKEELLVRAGNLIQQRALLREKFAHDFLLASESDEGALHYNTLRGILDIIHHHLEDAEFNMNAFGRELGMTRSQLFRKIRLVTNTTPNELVKIVRMKRAAQLLRSTDLNVTQVMYEVGMQNPSHFAKSFKKYYKVNPAKYRKGH